jgi:hypothetical protein
MTMRDSRLAERRLGLFGHLPRPFDNETLDRTAVMRYGPPHGDDA